MRSQNLSMEQLLAGVRSGTVQARFEREVKVSVAVAPVPELAPISIPQPVDSSLRDDVAPAPSDPWSSARRPIYRRIGRRVLRMFRPLALPFLNRLQMRIAAGFEMSSLAAQHGHQFQQVSRTLDGIAGHLDELVRRARSVNDDAGSVVHQLAALDQRLRRADEIAAAQTAALSVVTELLQDVAAQTAALSVVTELLQDVRTAATAQLETQRAGHDDLMHRLVAMARQSETAAATGSRVLAHVDHLLRARALAIGGEVLCRTSHGWLLVPAEDLRLVAAMTEQGESLEPGTAVVLQAILAPGDTAVDAGANIGALTLIMAASVGPAGRVIAFEPTPRCADLLRRTIVLNGQQDVVHVHQLALGATPGQATLHLGLTSGHNSLLALAESHEAVEVAVQTLDHVLPPDSRPTLIKLDVEGAELDVLAGMAQLLVRVRNISLIVEFGPSHLARARVPIADWLSAFAAYGFTPWAIDEAHGTLHALPTSGLDALYSVNLLMLRQSPDHWPRLRVGS